MPPLICDYNLSQQKSNTGNVRNHIFYMARYLLVLIQWNPLSGVLLILLIYFALPMSLFWSLKPRSWPHYIGLSVTLVWSWVVIPLCIFGLLENVVKKIESRWFKADIIMALIYFGAVAVFTLAYPPLLLNIGDLPNVGQLSWKLRILLPALVELAVVICFVYLCRRYQRMCPSSSNSQTCHRYSHP